MSAFLVTLGRWFSQFTIWVAVAPWEQGLRVRAGRRVWRLAPGFHWRIPILDVVHRQTVRMRSCHLPTQTLSTVDGATVTIGANLGYSIADIGRLYDRLHHAQDTLTQLAAAALAMEISKSSRGDLNAVALGEAATAVIQAQFEFYGIEHPVVRVTDFAFVRTYRLIQDQRWSHDSANDALSTSEARQ